MDYFKLYNAFIEKFKNQTFSEGEYTEVHHILPRYAGGTDDKENLVRLTYQQHVFVHKLWYKATGDVQAKVALHLMSGLTAEKKRLLSMMAGKIGGRKNVESGHMEWLCNTYASENGKRNVENGHLDNIRHLANTPERQEKLLKLHEVLRQNGHYERAVSKANEAWIGCHHTEEFKQNRSELYKERFRVDPASKEKILEAVRKSAELKKLKSQQRSDEIIINAERNEVFLHKTSSKSLNVFISPEGLEFDSPVYAAKYYGGSIKPSLIENWCKRGQNGWSRKPKDSA